MILSFILSLLLAKKKNLLCPPPSFPFQFFHFSFFPSARKKKNRLKFFHLRKKKQKKKTFFNGFSLTSDVPLWHLCVPKKILISAKLTESLSIASHWLISKLETSTSTLRKPFVLKIFEKKRNKLLFLKLRYNSQLCEICNFWKL